jgi:hypothetical protein
MVSTGEGIDIPSADGDTLTNFKFERPVYLAGGSEYAIVLLTGTGDAYKVWTAEVDKNRVGTVEGDDNRTVSSSSYLGSLFKSQNGSTWTPDPDKDLMFRLHKCVFDTTVNGSAVWKSANTMSHYVPSFTRTRNALAHVNWSSSQPALSNPSALASSRKLWDNDFDYHRFRVDATSLNYPSGFTNFSYVAAEKGDVFAPNINNQQFIPVALHEDIIPDTSLTIIKNKNGSFALKGLISTNNEDISPMINLERLSLTMIKNLISDGGLYSNTWPSNYIAVDGEYNLGNTVGGGFYIETAGEGYDGTEAVVISTSSGRIGVEAKGNTVINSMGSLVGVTLQNAGNTYVSTPTISLFRNDGVSAVNTGTGGSIRYVGETSPQGPGNFLARYVTKSTVMHAGVEAKDLKIYLTAAQPRGTRIWVYTKVRSPDDLESFEDKNWALTRRMQPWSSEVTPNGTVFREIRFMGSGDDEFPLAYSKIGGERFNTFNEFAVKIVMQSSDALVVPVIKDFRAVAVE